MRHVGRSGNPYQGSSRSTDTEHRGIPASPSRTDNQELPRRCPAVDPIRSGILHDDSELRAALGRAEDAERRIAERMAQPSGRYARIIDDLDGEEEKTPLRAVDRVHGCTDRQAG